MKKLFPLIAVVALLGSCVADNFEAGNITPPPSGNRS
jgi:hypothetical protein